MQSARKIAIKNFKRRFADTEETFEKQWNELSTSIGAIQTQQKVGTSLEQLYKTVEVIASTEKGASMAYHLLVAKIRSHMSSCRENVSFDKSPEDFLTTLNQLWANHWEQTLLIRNIFLYLDRTFVLQDVGKASIWDASLSIFREEIVESTRIRHRLILDLLGIIKRERQGEKVDRSLLRSLLRMLTNLQLYSSIFEGPFFEETKNLYSAEGEALVRDLKPTEYLVHVEKRLFEEEERVDVYLDENTRKPLIAIVEAALIEAHTNTILTKGADSMITGGCYDDIRRLYELLGRVKDGHNRLRNSFSNYIKKVGSEMVADSERDATLVNDLMEFKEKMDHIITICFADADRFWQAERDAFDYFISTRPNKPAELIAKFIDSKLRLANKEASDEEMDHLMDRVVAIFRFIQGKDVFEAFYKKDLAKRLLLNRSASVDAEKIMLAKLRQECGSAFTHKLDAMFRDMENSKEYMTYFKQYCDHLQDQGTKQLPMEFNVNVLTCGQWPSYDIAEMSLPQELSMCLTRYQDFYTSKHANKRLQWLHALGNCVLKATFRTGCVKELLVSLYQCLVLLLFNCKSEWTYEEILANTKIEAKELQRTLQSLACAKVRVLLKVPKGRDINSDDKFTVNTAIQEKLFRIKISQVQMKETPEEHAKVEEEVSADRQYAIDAAVVRIMKTRKTLPHTQLIQELFSQLRFPVKAADLKARISSLIEREYVTRDPDDPNIYKYVA
ncbi:hypothetical protein WR25_24733 [Diploscapter pachys]|uniref:Cullin family profile domain-containing protein n=1 Tax=Diploscapter pachys TaxID=2018661 RepID=A0A2A2L1J7_9BILA|nr:hypothetical protein WR25_24733 [Diploscapter pachys]